LISAPHERVLRVEIPHNSTSTLADELYDLGYDLRPMGSNTRIIGGYFVPVQIFAFELPVRYRWRRAAVKISMQMWPPAVPSNANVLSPFLSLTPDATSQLVRRVP